MAANLAIADPPVLNRGPSRREHKGETGMNKSVAVAAVLVVAACATNPPPPPPPVVAVVKAQQTFPPRPLTLLYTTFQDHAVLQRDKPIPVWGLTGPGAQVEVSFAGKNATATADAAGHWQAELPAMGAGGPYTLSATSSTGQSQTLSDVMVGDVYLCSGQSNMELPLRLATNYDSEMRSATNSQIRLFHVQRFSSAAPRETFGADASWAVTSPEAVKEFSAVCYYFGSNLQPVAGIPVGLVEDAWGGAVIQAWISNEKLHTLGGYDQAIEIAKAYAASAKEGEAKWRAAITDWWNAHDPALKASPAWNDPAFDDSNWATVIPDASWHWRLWDSPQLKNFNGIVWLRKTIEVTAAQAGGPAVLSLGPIDTFDIAWVNGKLVGAMQGYDVPRVYEIPAGTLHEGKNVLALAVQSGVGILSPGDKMNVKFADGSVMALSQPWRWKASAPMQQTGSPLGVPWLNQFGLSTLYNGMIVPLGPTQIRGIVWYQGESDAGHPKEYARLLPALIEDWRSKFGANMPFYVVQLPSFGPPTVKPGPSDWASLREVQRRVVDATPDAGLAVTIDLGSPDNIHPQSKQEVGRRLALLAERDIYGRNIAASSPSPLSVSRIGKKVTIAFAHAAQGLVAREWDHAIGFALCNADGSCFYTDGYIHHDTVELNAAHQPRAVSVRYCWADSPLCNLYSSDGLPAVPFEMAIAGKKLTRTARHRDFRAAKAAK
jgi:sialate O-acetylesterase